MRSLVSLPWQGVDTPMSDRVLSAGRSPMDSSTSGTPGSQATLNTTDPQPSEEQPQGPLTDSDAIDRTLERYLNPTTCEITAVAFSTPFPAYITASTA